MYLESTNHISWPNLLSESLSEELQRIAPDKFFVVWEQDIEEKNEKYEINYNYKEWILACFKNQWEKIESFLSKNNPLLLSQIKENITILDLWEIRKWKNSKLFWKDLEKDFKLQLISWWSMNLLTSKKGNKHLILTTRDWWNVDKAMLTWVAWRCETPDLDKESLKEFVEEGSYLWYLNWELHIIIPSVLNWWEEIEKFAKRFLDLLKKNAIDNTKSIIWFLSEKYKPENEKLAKMFNKNFRDKNSNLNYSNLKTKLEYAIKRGKILFYDISENKENYNSTVKIWDKNYEWYVYNDKENNTTEFRKVYNIDLSKLKNLSWKEIKEEVNYIWRLNRPTNMYLESENQEIRTANLKRKIPENIYKRLVPATKDFVENILLK